MHADDILCFLFIGGIATYFITAVVLVIRDEMKKPKTPRIPGMPIRKIEVQDRRSNGASKAIEQNMRDIQIQRAGQDLARIRKIADQYEGKS